MLQCSKRLPSLTFLQTCELQAKKLTSSSKTLCFSSIFKGTELLELDLGIFQAIDVRVSKEMPWRPTVPTHGGDRRSTSYKVLRVLWYIAKSVPDTESNLYACASVPQRTCARIRGCGVGVSTTTSCQQDWRLCVN